MKRYAQAEQVLEEGKRYGATISTTQGDITVELFPGESPKTANNFAFLASEGYYDDTVIHRVVPGFVVQMGDPTGTGSGGPGYKFDDELAAARNRGYTRGILAMANSGPNTNGSQFFICLANAGLPPAYTVFGEVTDGMDVVDDIATQPRRGEYPTPEIHVTSVKLQEL